MSAYTSTVSIGDATKKSHHDRLISLINRDPIDVAQVKALDGNGLKLTDDSDTLGVFIEDGGYVGIGIANPLYKCHINSNTNVNISFYESSGEQYISAHNDANSANIPLRIYGSEISLRGGNVCISATPATTGIFRLPTTEGMYHRNSADTADILIASWGAGNQLNLGDANTGDMTFTTAAAAGNDFHFINHGTTAEGATAHINAAGWFGRSTSSRKYKSNIRKLEIDPYKILDLQLKTYESKCPVDNNATFVGLIAEEVYSVLPEFVMLKDDEPDAIDTSRLLALLIPVVKQQQAQIQKLVKRIEVLEDAA